MSGQKLYVVKSAVPEPVWTFFIWCFEPIKNMPMFSRLVKTSPGYGGQKIKWTAMKLLFHHWPKVQFLSFSPDSRLLAVNRDGRIRLLEARTGQEVRILEGLEIYPCKGLFTDDGKVFGTLADNGEVRLWDVSTGRLLRSVRLSAHAQSVRPAISPGLNWGVCTTDDHTIEVWNLRTGLLHKKIPPIERNLDWFVFTPDGQILLATDRERKVLHCFEMTTGRTWNIDLGDPVYPLSIVCSLDGSRFAATPDESMNWQSRIWILKTGKRIAEFRADPSFRFNASIEDRPDGHELAFSPNGNQFATVKDESIQLFDIATQKMLQTMRLSSAGGAIVFAQNGKILVGQDDNVIRFWDCASGLELPRSKGLMVAAYWLHFSEDGKTLISADLEGTIQGWDAVTSRAQGRMENCGGVLAISRNGNTVITRHSNLDDECTIRAWDIQKKVSLSEFRATPIPIGRGDMGFASALVPDGRFFAFGIISANTIEFRDTASGRVRFLGTGDPAWGFVSACCFSPDGKILAAHFAETMGKNTKSTLALFDAATGRILSSRNVPVARIDELAFSPDGKWLIGHGLGDAHAWEVATLQPFVLSAFHFPQYDQIKAVGTAWDGRILAVLSTRTRPYPYLVIDLANDYTVCKLPHEYTNVRSFTFSAGGKRLAAGTYLPDILIWDLTTLAGESKRKPPFLSQQELENCWRELGLSDSAVALRAQRLLRQSPQLATAYLKTKIKPSEPMDLGSYFAALNEESFRVRDAATKKLEAIGRLAEPSMRTALTKAPPLEVRRRLELILDHMPLTGDDLRQSRAVQLLEQIGDSEAVSVLKHLAEGWAEAPLTIDAKASLERLARRETTIP